MATRRKSISHEGRARICRALGVVAIAMVAGVLAAPARAPKHKEPSRDAAQALFDRSAALYALQANGAKPFRLEATYREMDAEGHVLDGHMVLYWKAPDVWRSEIVVGDSKRVEMRLGDKGARLDSSPLTLEEEHISAQLRDKLHVGSLLELPEESAVTLKQHTLADGSRVSDVAVRNRPGAMAKGFRIDMTTGALKSVDDSWGYCSLYRSEVREGILVPIRVEGFIKDKQISLWTMTALSEWQPLDEGLLAFPEGAAVYPECQNAKDRMKLVGRVDPRYPKAAMAMGLGGNVVMAIRVSGDGSVVGTQVLRSTGAMFDEAAIQAVKQWKYRLAPCMAAQAPVRWLVTVDFQAAR
jgi:protein TonB